MELLPEWAPNLHPMVVHFPLALLSIAFLFDLLTFLLPQRLKRWARNSTMSLYTVGALTAVGVYFTGEAAADSLFIPTNAQSVLNSHADWALLTVWFYGLYIVLRYLAVWLVNKIHRTKVQAVFFILSMAGLFLLYQTGDRGGQMVYQYGVGVQTSEGEEEDTTPSETQKTETAFERHENGDWSWKIQKGALQTLQEHFRFLDGSAEELNAEAVETGGSYHLHISGEELSGFVITDENYQNVQVDYYLDISGLKGTVTLTNHVQNEDNYDYVSITGEGTVEQGRISNGQAEVFEKGNADVTEPIFVRTVANGTHFRGYIDKEMIVHGHGDAPRPGGVGLIIDGSGILKLKKIELTQLSEE